MTKFKTFTNVYISKLPDPLGFISDIKLQINLFLLSICFFSKLGSLIYKRWDFYLNMTNSVKDNPLVYRDYFYGQLKYVTSYYHSYIVKAFFLDNSNKS